MRKVKQDIVGVLTHEEVLEYQILCKKVNNVDITYEDAESEASETILAMEEMDRYLKIHPELLSKKAKHN